jgi:serine palmitoyltransferase
MNTGLMAPLPGLLELRAKYKLRFFLDESISIGTIGKTGHGLTEYFNIPPSELDMISGTLEYAIGSIGGFCVGSHFIVEHQRLSGLGTHQLKLIYLLMVLIFIAVFSLCINSYIK